MGAAKKPNIVDSSKALIANAKKKKSAKDGLPCILFVKGSEKGGVLVGARGKPIPKAEVREQRKPFTGGQVYMGVCYGIENGVAIDVFGNPGKDKLPEGPKFKKIVNEFLDTSYKTVRGTVISKDQMGELAKDFGDLGDEMGGEEQPVQDTAEQQPGTETAPDNPIAALTTRFKGLQELLKRVMTNSPDHQAALKKAAAGVIAQLKAGESGADKARDAIDKLETILGKLDKTSTGTETDTGAVNIEAIKSARGIWQDASDAVDSQISALQSALRSSGDEELEEIAEFGLNGVTGNFKVPLMAALRDVESANDDALPKAAQKAHKIVVDFRKHIKDSEQIAACDQNPFGVSVSIGSTLGEALDSMERALAG